jgi:hypothetical protein
MTGVDAMFTALPTSCVNCTGSSLTLFRRIRPECEEYKERRARIQQLQTELRGKLPLPS